MPPRVIRTREGVDLTEDRAAVRGENRPRGRKDRPGRLARSPAHADGLRRNGARTSQQGRRRGLQLGVAMNACAFARALGFALPLLIVGIPLRAVLAWASRGGLDR